MKIFISGGCKNGKSSFAQDIAKKLAGNSKLYYVATMIPRDDRSAIPTLEEKRKTIKHSNAIQEIYSKSIVFEHFIKRKKTINTNC